MPCPRCCNSGIALHSYIPRSAAAPQFYCHVADDRHLNWIGIPHDANTLPKYIFPVCFHPNKIDCETTGWPMKIHRPWRIVAPAANSPCRMGSVGIKDGREVTVVVSSPSEIIRKGFQRTNRTQRRWWSYQNRHRFHQIHVVLRIIQVQAVEPWTRLAQLDQWL